MKRCPHCRQPDHDDAIMCKHCMRNFADPVTPAARSAAKTGDAAKKAGDAAKKAGAAAAKKGSPLGSLVALLLMAGVGAAVMMPELRDQLIARYVMQEPAPDPSADQTPTPATEPPVASTQEPAVSPPATTQEAAVGSAPVARDEVAAPPRAEPQPAAEEPRRVSRGRGAPQQPKTTPPRATPPPSDRPAAPEPAAAPANTPPPVTQPLRVGGNIQPPGKIRDVKPTYPRAAVSARVQGIVIIEATIGSDGRVQNARVLRCLTTPRSTR